MKFAPMGRAISLGAALLFFGNVALANGRFPATNAVIAQPGDSKTIALRATYGVLISKDAGDTWDWICERAIGYSGNEDPSLVLSASGAIVVGTFNGTSRSTDGGCHWSHDTAWPSSVVDLTTRPNSADRIYAITNAFSKMSDAGSSLYTSQLFISEDAGAHWSSRTTFDPTLLIDSIEVAPNAPARAYVSAVRSSDHDARGVLLISDDDGAHWKEREIKLISQEHGVYIAAIDPKNPSRVYVRTATSDASRLLVTDDAGVSFREISRGALLQGFALADDGATIFAGDKSGLLRASASDDHFDRVSSNPVQCLTSIGNDLWACAPTSVGYVLGASRDRGATFSPKLALGGMRGELQCAAPSAVDECAADWSALQSLVSPTPTATVDASTARADDTTSSARNHSIFSCALDTRNARDDIARAAFALVALAFFVRRKYASKQA